MEVVEMAWKLTQSHKLATCVQKIFFTSSSDSYPDNRMFKAIQEGFAFLITYLPYPYSLEYFHGMTPQKQYVSFQHIRTVTTIGEGCMLWLSLN